jgi:hypothetical protein
MNVSSVTSLTAGREPRAEKYEVYFNFKQFKICVYMTKSQQLSMCYILYLYLNIYNPFDLKVTLRIVASVPHLQRASFSIKTEFLPYSTTIKLLSLYDAYKQCYLSLRTSLQC